MKLVACEAVASSSVPIPRPRARSPHIPPRGENILLVSVLFCNTSVKPAALLYFLIYTRYPAGIALYYIRLKAEMCP